MSRWASRTQRPHAHRTALIIGVLGLVALVTASIAFASVNAPLQQARAHASETPRSPVAEVPPVLGVQYTALWDGVSEQDRRAMTTAVSDAGAGWVRLDVAWASLQPNGPDQWDLEWGVPRVDDAIAAARERGLKVLLTFYWAPAWATDDARKSAHPEPGAYADAIAWAAKRWQGDVAAYEVWNEPNGTRFWDPADPGSYADLLKAAYPAVKQADPDALVVMGGTEYVDVAWIEALYAAGAGGSYDVLAVHPYPSPANLPPDAAADGTRYRFEHLRELVRVMRVHGEQDVPIWLTEIGWSTHDNTPMTPDWAMGVSEQEQADFLYESVRLVSRRYPQVDGVFWYTIRDTALGDVHQDGFGLLRADGSPKPAWQVLRCLGRGVCA